MAGSMRMERVARRVQMALAEVLIEGLKDPRYSPVTVTHVRVSPDLRQADVRFMPLGQQGDAEEIQSVLNAASGYLQREVGRRVRLKFTPKFRFHIDVQGEEAEAAVQGDVVQQRVPRRGDGHEERGQAHAA